MTPGDFRYRTALGRQGAVPGLNQVVPRADGPVEGLLRSSVPAPCPWDCDGGESTDGNVGITTSCYCSLSGAAPEAATSTAAVWGSQTS